MENSGNYSRSSHEITKALTAMRLNTLLAGLVTSMVLLIGCAGESEPSPMNDAPPPPPDKPDIPGENE
jgi:hypothetical protein